MGTTGEPQSQGGTPVSPREGDRGGIGVDSKYERRRQALFIASLSCLPVSLITSSQ